MVITSDFPLIVIVAVSPCAHVSAVVNVHRSLKLEEDPVHVLIAIVYLSDWTEVFHPNRGILTVNQRHYDVCVFKC